MQTFFEMMFMGVMAIFIFSNLIILAKISFLVAHVYSLEKQLIEHKSDLGDIYRIIIENDRSLQTLKEAAVKPPIKPNNWDAINKAFTRPSTRVEVHERD